MSLKERINLFFSKIDDYIKDTPNRKERKFDERMLRDGRKLEALQLKTDIEMEKSEIEKQRILREAARLKLRQVREKSRPKNDNIPMSFSMVQEEKRRKPLPIGIKF